MNQDPTAREWLRVVKYHFRSKQRLRNEQKVSARLLVRAGTDLPKDAKGV